MTKKYWMLTALAVVLGGISLYLNQDWFAKENIQIIHRSMPPRPGFGGRRFQANAAVNPVLFGLEHNLKLTAVKVIPVCDIETNKYPHPIWHLVSDSNSVPIKSFFYGQPIAGMRPAVKGTTPEALQPDVNYRLLLEAGPRKSSHDFTPVPRTP
ncbi:MAG TPA: hypothetical protein VNT26_02790 [Candidatus Sulfotelmatobacter sp.]|nr:hypothetical protein [Candidatus Sulfotelmatobacter sp.]